MPIRTTKYGFSRPYPPSQREQPLCQPAEKRKKTVIMIAHRLSSVTEADCIYVLKDGKIVESGTYRELIEKKGIFTNMWENYSKGAKWKIAKEVKA